jgi:hypothetical protein
MGGTKLAEQVIYGQDGFVSMLARAWSLRTYAGFAETGTARDGARRPSGRHPEALSAKAPYGTTAS